MTTTKTARLMLSDDDEYYGFRIREDGKVELMTAAEARTAIARALNEAVAEALRPVRRLH